LAELIRIAGFDEVRFSEQRYDTFSDAPSASSADAFGTQGVNIWAVKPTALRPWRAPSAVQTNTPKVTLPAHDPMPDPDEIYDAGALGCGDGPLTHIAGALKRMPPGAVLEVRSTDPGVTADLPAWCRMVGHTFLGGGTQDYEGRYFVRRKDG
jgi:tRNA 2-thiouridine synthesizing protein A